MSPSKGNTNGRGYGTQHQRLRARWAPVVAAGGATCWRCGQVIRPGQPWDLGHTPGSGKRMYSGPQHTACNRDTADERDNHDPDPTPRTKW